MTMAIVMAGSQVGHRQGIDKKASLDGQDGDLLAGSKQHTDFLARVLPHLVVNNSDCSPARLTAW